MSSPLWQLEPASRFRSYQSGDPDHHELRAYFLVQITDAGRAEDHYRISVEGDEPIEAEFCGRDFTKERDLREFTFTMQLRPDDLDLRRNCSTTAWEDLRSAIEEGHLAVDMHGEADPEAAFKRVYDAIAARDPDFGVGIRWAVLGTSTGLKLELQALPAPAHLLNRDPRLSNDGCPAVSLASFGVQTPMTDTGPLQGPTPILFARHPERARESLKQDRFRPAAGKQKS